MFISFQRVFDPIRVMLHVHFELAGSYMFG